jgi:hypothetical protein
MTQRSQDRVPVDAAPTRTTRQRRRQSPRNGVTADKQTICELGYAGCDVLAVRIIKTPTRHTHVRQLRKVCEHCAAKVKGGERP